MSNHDEAVEVFDELYANEKFSAQERSELLPIFIDGWRTRISTYTAGDELDRLVKGLRGELNACQCTAYNSDECACPDTVWPDAFTSKAAQAITTLKAQVAELEAENVRLREAVRQAPCNLEDPSDPVTGLDETRKAAAILRAALNTPE